MALMQTVKLTLSEPPEGLSIQKVALSDTGVDVVLRADAANSSRVGKATRLSRP